MINNPSSANTLRQSGKYIYHLFRHLKAMRYRYTMCSVLLALHDLHNNYFTESPKIDSVLLEFFCDVRTTYFYANWTMFRLPKLCSTVPLKLLTSLFFSPRTADFNNFLHIWCNKVGHIATQNCTPCHMHIRRQSVATKYKPAFRAVGMYWFSFHKISDLQFLCWTVFNWLYPPVSNTNGNKPLINISWRCTN